MTRFLDPDACQTACIDAAKGLLQTAAQYEAEGNHKEAARLRDQAERHLDWAESFAHRVPYHTEHHEAA